MVPHREISELPTLRYRFESDTKVQPIPLVMHAAEVPIDDMSLVDKRAFFIESEELLCNIDIGVSLSGDLSEQIQSAAELPIEDRARQVVAAFRIASQKEPAAKLLVCLANRNVRTGHVNVPNEYRPPRQSPESAADNMRLH